MSEVVVMIIVELEPIEAGEEVCETIDEDSAPWNLVEHSSGIFEKRVG